MGGNGTKALDLKKSVACCHTSSTNPSPNVLLLVRLLGIQLGLGFDPRAQELWSQSYKRCYNILGPEQ